MAKGIVFKKGLQLQGDKNNVSVRIDTVEDGNGNVTSAVLKVEYPLDPSAYRMVLPNSIPPPKYLLSADEIGYHPNAEMYAPGLAGETCTLSIRQDKMAQVTLILSANGSKIDYGS